MILVSKTPKGKSRPLYSSGYIGFRLMCLKEDELLWRLFGLLFCVISKEKLQNILKYIRDSSVS
jgi:hypothetical protein